MGVLTGHTGIARPYILSLLALACQPDLASFH